FVPKAANRPVYSYRLSIIHFWSLIFIYIWAGPHHLLYSALPDWAQNLGVVFSVMLIAPSWGGMINGLLTLRGVWDKVREEYALNGFSTFSMSYWLLPRMFKTQLFSKKLANFHFWIGTLGIVLYTVPLYVAGFVQHQMWKDFNPDGTLKNNFMQTVEAIMPMY